VPLGPRRDHVCAFLRRAEGHWALVAVPRLLAALVKPDAAPLGPDVWEGTVLVLPAAPPGRPWRNVFTGEELRPREQDGQVVLPLAEVFGLFPVALLLARE
jgi:(1->4)-alpha-D-glucan 1-alpha-D-glucosylmutase